MTLVARPESIGGVLDAADEMDGADLLAGGTDLMVEVNLGRRRPSSIISLRRVPELRGWQQAARHLRIGAAVTYRELESELGNVLPALAAASRTVGSPPIRNAGTLGGNVATASPAGDTLPVLSALGATVRIVGRAGTRSVPLDDFIVGPKRTSLAPGEVIESVLVPRVRGPQQFLKVGTRNAMVISIASLALVIDLDARRVGCCLGSVGPRPLRARHAEEFISARLDWSAVSARPHDVSRFAQLVTAAAAPITDVRGTAEYRRHCIRVLAERALTRSLAA